MILSFRPELAEKVREVVAGAKNPLDAGAIRRLLKGEHAVNAKQKDAFQQWLASVDGLVEWPEGKAGSGPRYGTRTAEDVATEIALAAASATPVLPTKLIAAITKGKSGYPKDRAGALVAQMEEDGKLHRQPLLAESKYKLTTNLPEDSRESLRRVLRVVLRSLKALGEDAGAPGKNEETADERILAVLVALEPQKGLLVTAPRLRRAVAGISKQAFDEAVMRLYRSEKVLLHRHSGPFLLTAEERGELIQFGDSFYVGVCWNTGEE